MLETRERKSGGARAPERATHGLVLVFETRERERGGARAPERARAGMFWCSRRGRGRGNTRTCPQEHVLVFGMWGTSRVSCGRQEWRVGAFSVEGNMLGLLGVESK